MTMRLVWALHHEIWVLLIFFLTVGLNIYLFVVSPKGFFPQQDTGHISGSVQADQSISFQAMRGKMIQLVNLVKADPAVATVAAFTGGSQTNSGFRFRLAEAAGRTGILRRQRHQSPAQQNDQRGRRAAFPAGQSGYPHGRPVIAPRNINMRYRPTISMICAYGRRN